MSASPLIIDDATERQRNLDSLDRKNHLVRDRVAAVVDGFSTSFYLFGAGGIGKSHTVLSHLDARNANYRLYNTRMTGKGLFRALEGNPDAVFVIEDMERLTKDATAQGVLRSALWAQPGHDRIVTWTTASGGEERVVFRGGLILLSNRPLGDLPELRALATRIVVMRLDVTDAECIARMYQLAERGYQRDDKQSLEAAECVLIVDYLVSECRANGCPPDLRLLTNSYLDFLQAQDDRTACGWQDLISSRVREAASHFRGVVNVLPREERLRDRRNVLRAILNQSSDAEEQLRLYVEQTGASRADFFRRKREINSSVSGGD